MTSKGTVIALASVLVASAARTETAANQSPAEEYRQLWYSRIQGENLDGVFRLDWVLAFPVKAW